MWLCCLFYAHFCQASIFTMCAWWKLTSKYSLVDEIWITVSKYSRYPKVCCSVILLQRQSFGQHPHLLDIYIPWVTFGLFFCVFQYVPFFSRFSEKKVPKMQKRYTSWTEWESLARKPSQELIRLNFFHANWFQLMTCRSQLIVHCIAPSSCESTLVNWVAWMWTTNHHISTCEILGLHFLVIF